jgi:hypothetical protein
MSAAKLLPAITSAYHCDDRVLEKVSLEGVRGFFNCSKCKNQCDDFMYQDTNLIICKHCCRDSRLIPDHVIDPNHPDHILKFHRDRYNHGCNKCRTHGLNVMYRCKGCDYDLCLNCSQNMSSDDSTQLLVVAEAKENSHILDLIDLTGVRGIFNCRHCGSQCNDFMYQCHDCRDYDLCVDCANSSCKLSAEILHSTHEHKLKIFKEIDFALMHNCDQCRSQNLKLVYRCHDCDYDLCLSCI